MISSDIILPFLLSAAAAYLIGSVSFSIIITHIFEHTDVREHGSGNAGATNVLRTAGGVPAMLTFALDFLKCVAAIVLAMFLFRLLIHGPYNELFARFTGGVFCLLGHIFPLYFGFRGGKGVTTSAAIIVMINWKCFLVLFSVFLIVLLITKIVSLSSIVGIFSFPFATFAIEWQAGTEPAYLVLNTLLACFITGMVIFMHRANIRRLRCGTESRLSLKRAR
jgi:glycerol-3-phosphate acyltransferase PlsY